MLRIEATGTLSLKSKGSSGISDVKLAYYVMEKADLDLSRYLEQNELDSNEKKKLILDFSKALMGLHALGIRHRDLKPDNIFFVGDKIKLGDLGLVDDRARDYSIDRMDEKIGPLGFLSPEAVNKAFGDRSRIAADICEICEKSDLFQLGLILFFILQGEVPSGCIDSSDFIEPWKSDDQIRESITSLLQYRKQRRMPLSEIVDRLITHS